MRTNAARGPVTPASPPAESGFSPSTTLAAAIYLGLSVLYFLPALLPGRMLFGTDWIAGGYVFHEFLSERLASGHLPKWVPYIYGGLPLFANPGSTYYPVRLLADLVFSAAGAFAMIFVVQFALAGLGAFLLAMELGVRRWIAFITGLAFQFTGLMMSYVYAGHDGRVIVATLTPLVFFFFRRGIRTGAVAPFVGAAATLGFALLSFQIQSAYYLLLASAAWAIYSLVHTGALRQPRALLRSVALGLAAVVFAFAMAAVNFLPFLEYTDATPRGGEGRGYEFATSWSMPPAELTGVALPEFVGVSVADEQGEPPFGNYRGENPFKLHTEYVGAFALLLLALGFAFSRRSRDWWFFLGLALVTLTFAFGGHTPLYRLYYELLPGTRLFRAPSISFFLVSTALVVMAALTLERLALLREERSRKHGDDPLRTATWILAGCAVLVLLVIGLASAGAGSAPEARSLQAGAARLGLFVVLVGSVLWAWLRRHLATRVAAIALAVLTTVDLWVVDRHFFRAIPGPAFTFAPDDVVHFLSLEPGTFRVWNLPIQGASYRGQPDNYLMHFDIAQAGGEHSTPLLHYVEYLGAGERSYVDWENLAQHRQFLNAANIRFLLASAPVGGFPLAYRGPSGLVFENPDALPRAYLVPEAIVATAPDGALEVMRQPDFDPRRAAVLYESPGVELSAGPLQGTAEIVEYEPDRVRVRTVADRPALLVLADNDYAGWEATVDGAAAPVLRANHTFRAVALAEGEHDVVFEFHPRRLYAGFTLYLLCLGALAAYGAVLLIRRRGGRARAPETPTTA